MAMGWMPQAQMYSMPDAVYTQDSQLPAPPVETYGLSFVEGQYTMQSPQQWLPRCSTPLQPASRSPPSWLSPNPRCRESPESCRATSVASTTDTWHEEGPGTQDRKIFVGGVPQHVEQRDLQSAFSHYGRVISAWLQKPKSGEDPAHKQKHRGFGFVVFASSHSVHKLLGCKDSSFFTLSAGQTVEIKRAFAKGQEQGDRYEVDSTPARSSSRASSLLASPAPRRSPQSDQDCFSPLLATPPPGGLTTPQQGSGMQEIPVFPLQMQDCSSSAALMQPQAWAPPTLPMPCPADGSGPAVLQQQSWVVPVGFGQYVAPASYSNDKDMEAMLKAARPEVYEE